MYICMYMFVDIVDEIGYVIQHLYMYIFTYLYINESHLMGIHLAALRRVAIN